jgi:hypothetical protein
MVYRPHIHGTLTPYPWYFDSPTHGIFTPLTHSISTPLPMVLWTPTLCILTPYPWHFDLSTPGIMIPLPMAYRPITMVLWPSTHGI